MPKRKSKIDFDTVRKIGLTLPGVEEGTAYGSPALKVRGQLLACIPVNPSSEPNSLAVRMNFDDRTELLEADPEVYYVTDHYLGYDAVLVSLSRVNPDALRDLLGMAPKIVSPKVSSFPLVENAIRVVEIWTFHCEGPQVLP